MVVSVSVSPSGVPVLSGPFVAFEGSRSLPASAAPLVSSLVASVLASGRGVATGCASGADSLVRSAASGSPALAVFSVAAGPWGRGRGAFAARSSALVSAVAASGPGSGFVGLVSSPCPAGLVPSSSSSRCFAGLGSGSWAGAAFAAGLGLPVVVFWFAPGSPELPASWGSWVPAAASGPWASGWRLVPPASQPSLF